MAQKFDVLIFSIFGRNHWLASQLKSSGLSVALMDLTPVFQKGLAEDWEGPFPLIFPDSVSRTYSQSFTDQDRSELLHRGPSLRVKGQGVFEFKSDHAEYILDRWKQKGIWVSDEDGTPQLKLSEVDFKEVWLRSFLKQWRSSTLKSLREVDEQIADFPLNSNYVLRQPSRRGYMESANWLLDTGVEVLSANQWWRLSTSNQGKASDKSRQSDGFELSLNNAEITIHAKKLIMGLTSYELQKFSGQVNLPEYKLKIPSAFWVRWRAKVPEASRLDFIPSYSMFFSDPEFGIFSENLITLIKRGSGDLDVWACLSIESLLNFQFQQSIQNSIESKLRSFVPEFGDLSLEDLRMGSDLFSVWPLYKELQPATHNKSNFIYDSPESWRGLDNYSRYLVQVQLIESLKKELLSTIIERAK